MNATELPRGWRVQSVAELQRAGVLLVEDGNHGENRPLPHEFVDTGVAFIRAADMGSTGQILFNSASRISAGARARIRKGIGASGDVLLSHKGTVGKLAIAPNDAEPFVCSPQTTFWRVLRDDQIDRRYLYVFMRSPYFHEQLRSRKGETDMADYVSLTVQRTLSVVLPTIDEQRGIGDVLGALDDKIELNDRTRETLRHVVHTRFALSYSASEADSWPVTTLADHVEVTRGLSYNGAGLADDGMPMHNLNSVYEGGGYKYDGLKRYTGEHKPRHVVVPGDLIVANTEQGHELRLIGYSAIVPKAFGDRGLFSHHLYRVRPLASSYLTAHFLDELLRSPTVREQIVGCTNGTTVNMLSSDGLQRPVFRLPPTNIVEQFTLLAEGIADRQENLRAESMQLTKTRDALLPRLLSGELRVRDAEHAISEAA